MALVDTFNRAVISKVDKSRKNPGWYPVEEGEVCQAYVLRFPQPTCECKR